MKCHASLYAKLFHFYFILGRGILVLHALLRKYSTRLSRRWTTEAIRYSIRVIYSFSYYDLIPCHS